MESITIVELLKVIPEVSLIDIRDNYRYRLGTIPTAVNIPMSFLMMNPENYLNKSQTYYFFCESGMRSQSLCSHLSKLGYHVVDVIGGYQEYHNKRMLN